MDSLGLVATHTLCRSHYILRDQGDAMAGLSPKGDRADRALCSLHGVNPMECFDKHQVAQGQGVEDVVEVTVVVLPCKHIVKRPERKKAIVVCGRCGTRWEMVLAQPTEHEWTARRV
jgi:hypothetical protein